MKTKYYKRLLAEYFIKDGIIRAGNNSKVLKDELKKIVEKLRACSMHATRD